MSQSTFPGPLPGTEILLDDRLTAGVLLRRVVAWWLDLALIGVIVLALWIVLMILGVLTLGLGFPLLSLLPLVPLAYHVGFLAGRAATPGQSVLGLVVLRDDDFGQPNLAQALVSTIGLYLTLAAGVVLLVVALFTVRRRTLHDLASGLVVVRRSALPPVAAGWRA
jgi:uncharacterized RDD family membrane protein YckC